MERIFCHQKKIVQYSLTFMTHPHPVSVHPGVFLGRVAAVVWPQNAKVMEGKLKVYKDWKNCNISYKTTFITRILVLSTRLYFANHLCCAYILRKLFTYRIIGFRSVTLRLASVAVLIIGVGGKILGCSKDMECNSCPKISIMVRSFLQTERLGH